MGRVLVRSFSTFSPFDFTITDVDLFTLVFTRLLLLSATAFLLIFSVVLSSLVVDVRVFPFGAGIYSQCNGGMSLNETSGGMVR
jgi:hypothetical protein